MQWYTKENSKNHLPTSKTLVMARENHQFSFESSVLLKSTSLQVWINNGANITVKILSMSIYITFVMEELNRALKR